VYFLSYDTYILVFGGPFWLFLRARPRVSSLNTVTTFASVFQTPETIIATVVCVPRPLKATLSTVRVIGVCAGSFVRGGGGCRIIEKKDRGKGRQRGRIGRDDDEGMGRRRRQREIDEGGKSEIRQWKWLSGAPSATQEIDDVRMYIHTLPPHALFK
jgi:hypothetical protein